MVNSYTQFALDVYGQIVECAIPVAFVFGMGNLIVNTFLSVAFGGRLRIGGGKHD